MEDRPLPVYDSMTSGGSVRVCTGQLSSSRIRTLVVRGLSVPRATLVWESVSLGNRYICIIHIYLPSLFTDYCPDADSHRLNNMAAPESDNIERHGHPPFQ